MSEFCGLLATLEAKGQVEIRRMYPLLILENSRSSTQMRCFNLERLELFIWLQDFRELNMTSVQSWDAGFRVSSTSSVDMFKRERLH